MLIPDSTVTVVFISVNWGFSNGPGDILIVGHKWGFGRETLR